jgi:septal ring factor EnvC (AmiA/AmiB activator)
MIFRDESSSRHCMTERVRTLAVVPFGIALMAAASAQTVDRTGTDALARRAAERMRTLQQEADRLATESQTLLGDLRKLEIERELRSEELAQITAKAQAVAEALKATEEQVARLERQGLNEQSVIEARLVELYKLGQGGYWRMLLSTPDVRHLGRASRVVAALAAKDRERFASYEERRKELAAARERLQVDARALDALRAAAERAQGQAARAVTARNQTIRAIDAKRDLNAQLAGELQGAQQKLQLTLRSMTNASATPSLPLRPFRGSLDWPVTGRLNQAFGRGAAGRPVSNGIQIAARAGTPVRVIHGGTVAFAGPFTGFGNLVIVDHGSQSFSLYGHLREISVQQGSVLETGALLGTTGIPPVGTPDAAGLYFELRIDGSPVDPLQWLRKT